MIAKQLITFIIHFNHFKYASYENNRKTEFKSAVYWHMYGDLSTLAYV